MVVAMSLLLTSPLHHVSRERLRRHHLTGSILCATLRLETLFSPTVNPVSYKPRCPHRRLISPLQSKVANFSYKSSQLPSFRATALFTELSCLQIHRRLAKEPQGLQGACSHTYIQSAPIRHGTRNPLSYFISRLYDGRVHAGPLARSEALR